MSAHTVAGVRASSSVSPAPEIATRPFRLVAGRVWKVPSAARAADRCSKIVDWYLNGKINIDDLITHTLDLKEINKGFDLMRGRVDPRRGRILTEGGSSNHSENRS